MATSAVHLAMWGPASAGKTALLAQLYLAHRASEWEIRPSAVSQRFIAGMRSKIAAGFFPPASNLEPEPIEYGFKHRRTRREVFLRLEDRPGSESQALSEPIRQQLKLADGLVLVFDLLADEIAHYSALLSALEAAHVARGVGFDQDTRPVAVCFSKADILIESLEDLRQAEEQPEDFARRHDRWGVMADFADRFPNRAFFPVSAAGVRLVSGTVEPVVYFDQALASRLAPGGRPINVDAAFEWLLGKVVGDP